MHKKKFDFISSLILHMFCYQEVRDNVEVERKEWTPFSDISQILFVPISKCRIPC